MIKPEDFVARLSTAASAAYHVDFARVCRRVDQAIQSASTMPITVPTVRNGGDDPAAVAQVAAQYRSAGWHVVVHDDSNTLMTLSIPSAATTAAEIYIVEEDRSEEYETIVDTIAAFDRRQDAEAHCRACKSTGSTYDYTVRRLPIDPRAAYAARRNDKLLGVHHRLRDAERECMDLARHEALGGSYTVTAHVDGRDPVVVWSRTYSAAEAAELRRKYLEICERLGQHRQPWAAVDELLAG